MASQHSTVEFICEQMGGAGVIRSRKMFGEYGVYCDDVFVGVICDDRLHLKITDAGERRAEGLEKAPAYEGAKPSFLIPEERLDDLDWMADFVAATRDDLR